MGRSDLNVMDTTVTFTETFTYGLFRVCSDVVFDWPLLGNRLQLTRRPCSPSAMRLLHETNRILKMLICLFFRRINFYNDCLKNRTPVLPAWTSSGRLGLSAHSNYCQTGSPIMEKAA
ncbi:hypothetical protein ACG2E4_11315 [Halalkalibaculum sp. DA384]